MLTLVALPFHSVIVAVPFAPVHVQFSGVPVVTLLKGGMVNCSAGVEFDLVPVASMKN